VGQLLWRQCRPTSDFSENAVRRSVETPFGGVYRAFYGSGLCKIDTERGSVTHGKVTQVERVTVQQLASPRRPLRKQ